MLTPPESRRCTVCGEMASFGFGPPSSPVLDADSVALTGRRVSGPGRHAIDRAARRNAVLPIR